MSDGAGHVAGSCGCWPCSWEGGRLHRHADRGATVLILPLLLSAIFTMCLHGNCATAPRLPRLRGVCYASPDVARAAAAGLALPMACRWSGCCTRSPFSTAWWLARRHEPVHGRRPAGLSDQPAVVALPESARATSATRRLILLHGGSYNGFKLLSFYNSGLLCPFACARLPIVVSAKTCGHWSALSSSIASTGTPMPQRGLPHSRSRN